jgi:prepilin-type N-terminal cleavage/methylation domain-containing protein
MTRRQDGFSMVEVLLAMVLLAIILTALAGFTFSTAQRALVAGDASTREAIKVAAVNRLNTVPWDTVTAIAAVGSRCDIVALADRNRYRRCLRVTASGTRSAVVWVVITPLQRGLVADSTRFVRQGETPPSPLCTSGNCGP